MRIGLSGVSSTGKSTLARLLSQRLSIPCLDEGMKDVYIRWKAMYNTDAPRFDEMSDAMKLAFQMDMIEHRTFAEFNTPDFVGDGTPLDAMAFWMEWATRLPVELPKYEKYVSMLQEGLSRYDLIIRCPFGVLPLEDDRRRIRSPLLLEKVSFILEGVTRAHAKKIPVHTLSCVELPSRVREIERVLCSKLGWDGQTATA